MMGEQLSSPVSSKVRGTGRSVAFLLVTSLSAAREGTPSSAFQPGSFLRCSASCQPGQNKGETRPAAALHALGLVLFLDFSGFTCFISQHLPDVLQ